MENYKDQLGHLKEMRSIMERSSKFLSLSGLSGILCGVYALITASIAYYILYIQPVSGFTEISYSPRGFFNDIYIDEIVELMDLAFILITIALVTLILSVGTALFLSGRKAKKQGDKLWNSSSKIMLTHLLVPLITGGIFGLICIFKGLFIVVGPITLIFYGLSLVSVSKFTFGEILYLGLLIIILGLINMFFLGYSLFFWGFGFGVLHIVYGMLIHFKYERNSVEA